MSARPSISVFFALGALLCGAGCGGGDSLALSAETEDPLYQQSLLLKKTGRSSEALTGLLKVIERRGEQASPESHLDAGLIYLEHIKDPVEAIHHFKKYLDLAPNSTKATLVRQKIDGARRELFRSMPGRPSDEPSARGGGQSELLREIERLQRENEDMRAELGRSKSSGTAPFMRTTRGPVEVAEPVPTAILSPAPQIKVASVQPSFVLPTAEPPAVATPQNNGVRPPSTKTGAVAGKSAPAGSVAGKRHTVAAGETLFAIGRKYGVKPEAIVAVNRDRLPGGMNSKLSPGMELKIP
jgi:hypothetical protein